MSERSAIIVGGGIGGVTAALCLAKAGFDVSLFEQREQLGEIGAGIQLSPNCTRVLHDLGLESALREVAFLPQATQFRSWRSGKVINESPLGNTVRERYGFPYYHIHRGDLLDVLANSAASAPQISLNLETRVEAFEQTDTGVRIECGGKVHEADVLIGADGIHSLVREALWGAERARFTGNVAWRALVPADAIPEGVVRPMSTAWWGPHRHFVHYFLRRGTLINCVCVTEKTGWEVESWTERGEYDELKHDFARWHDDIQMLIDNADRDSLYKWALFDREPMAQWGQGRVTLLGDACHPTLPFMAQGAAMAIEDGAVLAAALSQETDVPASLQRYENLRRDRTAGIQRGSRRNAKVFHLSGIQAWLRNRAARAARSRVMDGLFSYNALDAVHSVGGNQ